MAVLVLVGRRDLGFFKILGKGPQCNLRPSPLSALDAFLRVIAFPTIGIKSATDFVTDGPILRQIAGPKTRKEIIILPWLILNLRRAFLYHLRIFCPLIKLGD